MGATIWEGLSDKALDMVKGETVLIGEKIEIMTFYDGRPPVKSEPVLVSEPTIIRRVNGRYPANGIEYDMHEYHMPDGRLLVEVIQKKVKAKGMIFVFLALKNVETKECVRESLWTEREISKITAEIGCFHEAEMVKTGYSPS